MAGDIPGWFITLGSSALTAAAGFVLALVNRGPAMQAVIADATRTLVAGYEKRVDDLMTEIHALREEVVNLRKALDERPRPTPPFAL
jgi:hypothetical protein